MQDGNNAIEAVGLTKRYDGFLLNHVSFCIPQGTVMGFTGQNGAGMRLCYREMLLAKRSFRCFLSGMPVYARAGSVTTQDAWMPWQYFRMASPISPWQFACAKYLFLAAVCILELLCSFGYAAVCGISGMAFDAEKMAMIMVFSIITAVLAVISQFLLSRFHSKDLAGIVVMGGLLALTGGVSLILLLRDK